MKKLRLLITKECNRNCEGCCNKMYDLDKLSICNSFEGYDEIILTGGEPLVRLDLVLKVIDDIRAINKKCQIYLYTAQVDIQSNIYDIFSLIDGLTVTLHEQQDIDDFIIFYTIIASWEYDLFIPKSLRLHIFEGIDISKLDNIDLKNWKVKKNIKWIKNCPLPKEEVFMRLEKI